MCIFNHTIMSIKLLYILGLTFVGVGENADYNTMSHLNVDFFLISLINRATITYL